MRDLKKGDNLHVRILRPSVSMYTSYQFTESGCCSFKFTAQRCNLLAGSLLRPKEYECIARWNEIPSRGARYTQSVQALVFRVVEIEQDVWRQS
jgi:hypothetical protein